MKRTMVFLGTAAVLAMAAPAHATLIDFSTQTAGPHASPIVYPEATFSGSAAEVFINAINVGNDICASVAASSCAAALTVNFTNPVNGLSFQYYGDETVATLFVAGTATSGAFPTNANFFTLKTADLSAFGNVTSIVLTTTDVGGLVYDNFVFTPTAAVPSLPRSR